ncbi:uncharacterized protein [Macrobrachium rosenbergii]|uniref:uncharacterized protein n=1 Tax=Macrobrachium rosenbergii TaxID=79674 RepID=UPI0034D53302
MESTDYEAYEDDYFANCTSSDQDCIRDLSEPLGTSPFIALTVFKSLSGVIVLIGSVYTISLLAKTVPKYVLSRYVVTSTLSIILMLLVLPFDLATSYNRSWIFGYVLCQGRNSLFTLSGLVHSGMQVGICINTYIEESKSTPNSKLRSTAFKITSIVSWSFALAVSYVMYTRSEILELQNSTFCIISVKMIDFDVTGGLYSLINILTSVVPIIVSWILLGLAVSRKRTQPAAISLEEPTSVSWTLQKRSKQLTFAITITFTIFSMVHAAPSFMYKFISEVSTLEYMNKIIYMTAYLFPVSFIIDLVLYVIFMRDACKHFKKMGLSVDDPPVVPLMPVD